MKTGKRIITLLLAFVMVISGSFCVFTSDADALSSSYRLSRTSVTLVKGQKLDLFLCGQDAKDWEIIKDHNYESWVENVTGGIRSMSCTVYAGLPWKSSKPKVVSVSKNGTIKAKKAGKAKVKVRYQGKTYTCSVKVVKSLSKKQRSKMAKKEAKRIVKKYTNSSMSQERKAQILAYYMLINVGTQNDQSMKKYKKNYGNEAYSALIMHLSACSGHCKAYKMLCDAAGVKCRHVNANKWSHQWNEVYINGEWRVVDTQGGWIELPDDDSLYAGAFDITRMGPIYLKTKVYSDGISSARFYI